MNDKLRSFISKLEETNIHFELSHYRDDAISVVVTVPGQRWEVDFLNDGSIDVEKFVSNGTISGEEAFQELFANFSDPKSSVKNAAQRSAPKIVRQNHLAVSGFASVPRAMKKNHK